MSNLLVIDDSPDVAHLISEILRREGHHVIVCHNGGQAIKYIEKGNKFDLIITDLIMPDIDGIGLMLYLKKNNNTTPILVLSGGGVTLSSDDALKAVTNMATAVLKKPVQYDTLIKSVNTILHASKEAEAAG